MSYARTFVAYGKRYRLPWGFHVVNDLLPLWRFSQEMKRRNLSPQARKRLLWMDYFNACQNVAKTCRHFGISRKSFYTWHKRFNPRDLSSLEDRAKTPKRVRQREITPLEESRIVALRKSRIRYGKEKLARLYLQQYSETISAWKIQKVIEKYHLYWHPKKVARTAAKRKRALKKKRITELSKQPRTAFLLCLDVVVIYWNGLKRYIFTAIDHHSKIAFARMYASKSSLHATDFLARLWYLYDGKIENLLHDNGSEFHGMFLKACQRLGIPQYWNRKNTPKDNAVNERFNRTLQDEFVNLGNFTPDLPTFNSRLTEWLIEYNFKRPHQTLSYLTPIAFHHKFHKVLPMYPSNTNT